MKQTIEGFISFRKEDWTPDYSFHPYEMTKFGYVTVMPHTIEVDIPDDFDPVPAQLAALDAQEAEMRGKFAAVMIEIGRKRADLLAISNEVVA